MARYRNKQGVAKNKLSYGEKAALILEALNAENRRVRAINPDDKECSYGKLYSMGEIARLTGYSRSTRMMCFLYEMVDRGVLVKQEYASRENRQIRDSEIFFMLPETERMYRQADFLPREFDRG